MDKRELLLQEYPETEFLFIKGFDDAIVGIDDNFRVIYSEEKIIDILMETQDMSVSEARDHLSFNIKGTHAGDQTPVYLDDRFLMGKNK